MSTVTVPPAVEPAQQFVLNDLSWGQYVQILDGLGTLRGIRTAYDGRTLELMGTSPIHEWYKELLGAFLRQFFILKGLRTRSGGQMTFRREDLERGLEPDKCYWIANEPDVRNKWEFDFTVDPPPDLCVEIEVSRTVVDRLGILKRLGVPEVWAFDGRDLKVLVLEDGGYERRERSEVLPDFPIDDVPELLERAADVDENESVRRFVERLQEGSE